MIDKRFLLFDKGSSDIDHIVWGCNRATMAQSVSNYRISGKLWKQASSSTTVFVNHSYFRLCIVKSLTCCSTPMMFWWRSACSFTGVLPWPCTEVEQSLAGK